MKKTLFTTLFTLCLIFGLLPATVLADNRPTSGTCGPNLTWKFEPTSVDAHGRWEGGTLTISGTGAMDNFRSSYSSPWSSDYSIYPMTKVIIEEGVATIGDNAFSHAEHLTDVIIPDSLKSIGYASFLNCAELSNVKISNGVTNIASSAFDRCTSLTRAVL